MNTKDRKMKVCPKCKVEKTIEKFHVDKNSYDGRHGYCGECKNSFSRSRRLNLSPRERKSEDLRYSYGITIEEYDKLYDKQQGKCSICSTSESKTKNSKFLFVDHDHRTGRIRSLLCHKCNSALGGFNDDIDLLVLAIFYLIENNSQD